MELLQKIYIPSKNYCKEMYINYAKHDPEWDWIPINKVPIKKIKVKRELFDYPNEVEEDEVTYMVNNFYENAWEPIIVNEDYFLLDGQHRLRLAFRIGLKYIDLIMRKKKDIKTSKKIKDKIRREEIYQREIKKILGFKI